jgi:hypothetical protein
MGLFKKKVKPPVFIIRIKEAQDKKVVFDMVVRTNKYWEVFRNLSGYEGDTLIMDDGLPITDTANLIPRNKMMDDYFKAQYGRDERIGNV